MIENTVNQQVSTLSCKGNCRSNVSTMKTKLLRQKSFDYTSPAEVNKESSFVKGVKKWKTKTNEGDPRNINIL